MKKRILLILMVLVLAAVPLTGCQNSFTKAKLSEKQITTYTVRGNGGNAVQYGNFIYFINGFRGYENSDGKSNTWGKVTKGALYRVKLLGNQAGNEFVAEKNEITNLEFATKPFVVDKNAYEYYLSDTQFNTLISEPSNFFKLETDLNFDNQYNDDYEADYEDEYFYIEDIEYRIDNVELVAPKVIGTSGYADGGIFIFDNFVYYASPNNEKGKSGQDQTNKTDFFRTDLNGTKTEKIYTSSSETNTSPYGFYKQGNFTYLTVLDGTKIVSVKMNSKKIVSKNVLADNAIDACFPVKDIYSSTNNKTDGVEDFIYYTRAIEKEDSPVKKGTVIEVTRPNGKNRFELVKNGHNVSIEAVRDGLVFYRVTNSANREELHYTNMHEALLEHNDKKSAYSELVAGVAFDEIKSDYTSIYCFRPNSDQNELDNNIYIVGFTSSAVYIEDVNGRKKIINEQIVVPIIHGSTIYYADTSSVYYSANIFTEYTNNTPQVIDEQAATGAVINNSIVAGYFVYMGTVDSYATSYTKFYPINDAETAKPFFVGERLESEIKQPPKDN